ncbi:PTS sugar transporter subunit IIB [Lactobacillus sp. CC-MHH1034]|uniref:PTS sugar transporter subunit IIB n=1 Tax=Agrilactobacillus fermenti TaxID=2586909 RepID=UPI001E345C5D|nr:PTS sugar transporter subunit IIB [Agrilactobacillus fermenti]MCD2257342.1 PTS sugar transporter subunit IIB [Agrilactobacillus fermenti]
MADKTIMLVCAAGMSTSLMVSKMQNAAKDKGIDAEIFATAASDADEKISTENPDVLMLGPQVSYLLKDYQGKVDIPVEVINMQDYGMMRGEKVLDEALKLIDEAK